MVVRRKKDNVGATAGGSGGSLTGTGTAATISDKGSQRLPLPKSATNKPNNNNTVLSLLQNHPPHAQTRTKQMQTLHQ